MDNNKIMDNLNFIKIYFRIFIYKIIVDEKTWIIQKRDKYGLKTSLSARLGSRKPKKWVQNAPEHKSVIGIQECHSTLLECLSALSKCQMAPIRALARRSSGDDKTHHFQLFCRRTRPDSHSNRRCLFFKHSSLYK